MKVFTAYLAHETHSFSPINTSLASFKNTMFYRPEKDKANTTFDNLDGHADFKRLAVAKGYQVVEGFMAQTNPSAPLPKADYELLRDNILSDLKAAMPVDMVFLTLHGAQIAQGYDDCEGDVIAGVREIVGSAVPIGVELDLHFNLSKKMLTNATVINACKEYPHSDFSKQGIELFNIIEATAKGKVQPVMVMKRVPMLGQFHTTREPMRSFVDKTDVMVENDNGLLSVTLGHGFPWGDTTDTCACVIVVTDNNDNKANEIANDLADDFFALRHKIQTQAFSINKALSFVFNEKSSSDSLMKAKPIVIADCSDNPGGGAACDSTFILEAMVKWGIKNAVIAWLWDPLSVEQAFSAGVNARVKLRIGGKHGVLSGHPLLVEAKIEKIIDDLTQEGLSNSPGKSLGRSVVININGIRVILTSIRNQVFGSDFFPQTGIDPKLLDVIVVKSTQHFYDSFLPIAKKIIYCDAPGAFSCHGIRSLPFKKLKRPIWPLDKLPFNAYGRQWL